MAWSPPVVGEPLKFLRPGHSPDLLKKLPDIVKEGIKRKGIPAGKHITIVPKPDVDIKNLKFKGGTIGRKLTF